MPRFMSYFAHLHRVGKGTKPKKAWVAEFKIECRKNDVIVEILLSYWNPNRVLHRHVHLLTVSL